MRRLLCSEYSSVELNRDFMSSYDRTSDTSPSSSHPIATRERDSNSSTSSLSFPARTMNARSDMLTGLFRTSKYQGSHVPRPPSWSRDGYTWKFSPQFRHVAHPPCLTFCFSPHSGHSRQTERFRWDISLLPFSLNKFPSQGSTLLITFTSLRQLSYSGDVDLVVCHSVTTELLP